MMPPDDTFSKVETCGNDLWYIAVYKLAIDIHKLWKHNNGKLKSGQPISRSKIVKLGAKFCLLCL